VRTHRVGGARTKRWRANIGGIIASALLPLWLTELCVTVTRTTNQSQSQDQGQSQRQRQSQIIPKSRVDPKLGGTDPFGAFELPQNNVTDLALHHCKNLFLVWSNLESVRPLNEQRRH
jgi:hypothetical protein